MTSENKDADKWTEKERNLVRGTNGMAVKKRNEKKEEATRDEKKRKKRSQPNDRSLSVDHFLRFGPPVRCPS